MTTANILVAANLYAVIDKEDEALVRKYSWWLSDGYACAMDGKNKIYLHRLVMGFPEGKQVDHVDRDRLNCTKKNLRLATNQQNSYNKTVSKSKSTNLPKGVYAYRGNRFTSYIKHNYKQIYLGIFNTVEEAEAAYRSAAQLYQAEFAHKNSS